MGDSTWTSEYQNANKKVDGNGNTQEVSVGNNIFNVNSIEATGVILWQKILLTFYICSETFKRLRLMAMD